MVPDTQNLIMQCPDARVTKKKNDTANYFIVQPYKNPDIQDENQIYILRADSTIIDSIIFKVRYLECRYQIGFSNLNNYEMPTTKDLMEQEHIATFLPCSHYKKSFQIFKFDMVLVTQNGYIEFKNTGCKITEEMKQAISNLEIKDKIIITAYGEPYPYNSITQKLTPLVLEIWEW